LDSLKGEIACFDVEENKGPVELAETDGVAHKKRVPVMAFWAAL
jgi:hypothetical protein